MNKEVYLYTQMRARQQMVDSMALLSALLGLMFSTLVYALDVSGGIIRVTQAAFLLAVIAFGVLRQAMEYDGYCRQLMGEFDYPPLSKWYQDLQARDAFTDGGEKV